MSVQAQEDCAPSGAAGDLMSFVEDLLAATDRRVVSVAFCLHSGETMAADPEEHGFLDAVTCVRRDLAGAIFFISSDDMRARVSEAERSRGHGRVG